MTGGDGPSTASPGRSKTAKIARVSLFTSLAVVGSFISLPGPVSSVAFDSASGYFAAMNFDEVEGSAVLFAGHLATAIVHGFPLGLLHLPIALGLAFQGFVMAKVSSAFGMLASMVSGVAINTALTAIVIPFFGVGAAIAFLPFIFVGSLANGAVAYAVSKSLARTDVMKRLREPGSRR